MTHLQKAVRATALLTAAVLALTGCGAKGERPSEGEGENVATPPAFAAPYPYCDDKYQNRLAVSGEDGTVYFQGRQAVYRADSDGSVSPLVTEDDPIRTLHLYCGALYYDVIHGTDPFSYTRSSYRFDLQSGQKNELPFTVELCRLIGTTLYTLQPDDGRDFGSGEHLEKYDLSDPATGPVSLPVEEDELPPLGGLSALPQPFQREEGIYFTVKSNEEDAKHPSLEVYLQRPSDAESRTLAASIADSRAVTGTPLVTHRGCVYIRQSHSGPEGGAAEGSLCLAPFDGQPEQVLCTFAGGSSVTPLNWDEHWVYLEVSGHLSRLSFDGAQWQEYEEIALSVHSPAVSIAGGWGYCFDTAAGAYIRFSLDDPRVRQAEPFAL